MHEKLFENYFLVGGTALALQIGHRNSIDIDLFGNSEINPNQFINKLDEFGEVIINQSTKNILIAKIKGIKVNFVNYKYPLLSNPINIDSIRMLSKTDIAAMKINAITGRGSKKDFIDLYFLLKDFSLREILNFYNQKYHNGSEFMALKSLTYFEDADLQPQPQMFKEFDWEKCKQFILEETRKL